MCEIAVEIAGCEMLARRDASVMLPASAAAAKYDSWRSVSFMVEQPRYRARRQAATRQGSPGTPKRGAATGFCARRT